MSFDPSKDYQRSAESSRAEYIRQDSNSRQDFSNLRRYSHTRQQDFGDRSLMNTAFQG